MDGGSAPAWRSRKFRSTGSRFWSGSGCADGPDRATTWESGPSELPPGPKSCFEVSNFCCSHPPPAIWRPARVVQPEGVIVNATAQTLNELLFAHCDVKTLFSALFHPLHDTHVCVCISVYIYVHLCRGTTSCLADTGRFHQFSVKLQAGSQEAGSWAGWAGLSCLAELEMKAGAVEVPQTTGMRLQAPRWPPAAAADGSWDPRWRRSTSWACSAPRWPPGCALCCQTMPLLLLLTVTTLLIFLC